MPVDSLHPHLLCKSANSGFKCQIKQTCKKADVVYETVSTIPPDVVINEQIIKIYAINIFCDEAPASGFCEK
jgi:hypothetical protein